MDFAMRAVVRALSLRSWTLWETDSLVQLFHGNSQISKYFSIFLRMMYFNVIMYNFNSFTELVVEGFSNLGNVEVGIIFNFINACLLTGIFLSTGTEFDDLGECSKLFFDSIHRHLWNVFIP
jgi:hypothetical protein